jgi:hypothetical protein
MLKPTIVLQGQVVGIWQRRIKGDSLSISYESFWPFDRAESAAVEEAAQSYAAFLELRLSAVGETGQ